MANIRRGLTRLWIVLTALWGLVVAGFSYEPVVNPYVYTDYYVLTAAADDALRPISTDEFENDRKYFAHTKAMFPNTTVYADPSISESFLGAWAKRFARTIAEKRNGEVWNSRKTNLMHAALATTIPPAMILALGWMIGWAIAGFHPKPAGIHRKVVSPPDLT